MVRKAAPGFEPGNKGFAEEILEIKFNNSLNYLTKIVKILPQNVTYPQPVSAICKVNINQGKITFFFGREIFPTSWFFFTIFPSLNPQDLLRRQKWKNFQVTFVGL